MGEGIDKAYGSRNLPGRVSRQANSDLGMGLRIGLELVVAVLVGTGLGWLFDRELGTQPWALVTGFFLGVATGMVNIYRTAMSLSRSMRQQPDGTGNTHPAADESDED